MSEVAYRKRLSRGYVHVDNRVAEDSRLSYRARGVLLYLLAKPDGWQFRAETIARDGSEGRDAVRAALRELREVGYYRVSREQGASGRIVMVTEVSDVPRPEWLRPRQDTLTEDGKPAPGYPAPGKPPPKKDLSPDASHLPAEDKSSAAEPTAVERRAQSICQAWWEAFDPHPTQPFIAAKRIVMRLLATWGAADDAVIVRAMTDCGATVVQARVDAQLRGFGGNVGRQVQNRQRDRAVDDAESAARRAAWQ